MSTAPVLLMGAGLLGLAALSVAPSDTPAPPVALANANRQSAGRLRHDTLRVTLEVRMATWFPEADRGPSIEVAAFAEAGQAPQIPGPLLRVRAGTPIDAIVRNGLPDSTITVRGLVTHPATTSDSLVIPPGRSARVRFPAGAPGTYLYSAAIGIQDTLVEREQLAGAFVVDSSASRADDRIFVISSGASRRLPPCTGTR